MSKIGDLVRDAQDKYEKAQKGKDAIERMRAALTTISKVAHVKGKE